ncbi:Trans-1,2-dihydrobenzene-1,2-diol dehydrogenase [Lentibacillus sp. JNUCC-1]|uniref:Gfo/Idh/MocA family protein n=1 Tax=Lentibacillus sp. JNUCC-1 TaxID=2654513 RepID=UPI001325CDE3|nr:Trans-1,2-dihydrobenzene-1,2-diol dehydrogenase [Lentibacillus sp. JNUCC-1]
MTKIQWGILSTANIAQKALIPAIQRAKNAEVTAIASGSDAGKARAVAEKFEIPKTHDRYEALLEDPDIQAVYIPLPNHLHKKWVIEAAKAGKHILCEKPIGLDEEEAREMQRVCEENGVLLMEAFMYHFHPQHERVKEIMASGEIGDVRYMRAAFSFFIGNKADNIRMHREKGGGCMYDVGSYGVHSIRNILGKSRRQSMFTQLWIRIMR